MRKVLLFVFVALLLSLLFVCSSTSENAETSKNADFDESGVVDFPDFLLFVSAFGSQEGQKRYEARYDLNGDGAIGFDDFLVFVSSFGKRTTESVSDLQGESLFGVSTLAKTGESIGVILLKGNLAAVHHYVLEPTQEDHQQKAATFAIDEKTGEVRLKIEPASWGKRKLSSRCRVAVATEGKNSHNDCVNLQKTDRYGFSHHRSQRSHTRFIGSCDHRFFRWYLHRLRAHCVFKNRCQPIRHL